MLRKLHRFALGVVAAATVASGSLALAVAPAMAYPAIDAQPDDVFLMQWPGQLYRVDPVTGATTGPLSEEPSFSGPPGFEIDSTKDLGYFVSYADPSHIYTLDLSTGLFNASSIALPARNCRAVDLQYNGALWAACDYSNTDQNVMVRVDLDAGTAEQVGGSGLFRPAGLATNPLDSTLYVFGDGGEMATVDQDTGAWSDQVNIGSRYISSGSADYMSSGDRVTWRSPDSLNIRDHVTGEIRSVSINGAISSSGEGMAVAGETGLPSPPALGGVTISGDLATGSVLLASPQALGGVPRPHLTYQWQQQISGAWTDLPGETNRSFTLKFAQIGDLVRVVATATSTGADPVEVMSEPAGPIIPGVPDAPVGVVANPLSSTTLQVSWAAGGGEISDFTVTAMVAGQVFTSCLTTDLTCDLVGFLGTEQVSVSVVARFDTWYSLAAVAARVTMPRAPLDAHDGDIFISQWSGGLYQMDPVSGVTRGPLSENAPFDGPPGFDIDATNDVGYFVSYANPARLYTLDLSTGLFNSASIQLPGQYCLAVDLAPDGVVWVGCDHDDTGNVANVILKVDVGAGSAIQVGGDQGIRPAGLGSDRFTGQLYLMSVNGPMMPIDLVTGAAGPFVASMPGTSLDFSASGDAYSYQNGGPLTRRDHATGASTSLTPVGERGSEGFAIANDIVPGGLPPTFVSSSPPLEGLARVAYDAYTFSVSAWPKATFSVNGTLPDGLTLNADSGILSGTPTTQGDYTFSVVADNGVDSPATTGDIIITVADPPFSGVFPCGDSGNFTVTDGVVTGSTDCAGAVEIPERVSAIGVGAFQDQSVTTAVLPSMLTEIAANAFMNSSLESIAIPGSVTVIGNGAFSGARLESIAIPDSVTSLGSYVFSDMRTLVSAVLGDGVTELPSQLFQNDSSLRSIVFPSGLTRVGFNFAHGTNLGAVVFPDSLTTVDGGAFSNAGLTSLTLNDSLETIRGDAFRDNSSLTEIRIPASVTTIESGAFASTGITAFEIDPENTSFSVVDGSLLIPDGTVLLVVPPGLTGSYSVPESVTTLATGVFSGSRVTPVSLGSSLTEIPANAFMNSLLESITIPDSVTSIGNGAFSGARLTSITIPDSVTSLGSYAFSEMRTLVSAVLGDGVTELPSQLFQNDSSLRSIVFPSGLTRVGFNFAQGTNLGAVVLPDTVTTVDGGAFSNAGLIGVRIGSGVESLASDVFNGNPLTTIVYCGSNDTIFDNLSLTVIPSRVCADPPSAPQVAVVNSTLSGATLQIIPPGNNGGTDVIRYQVTVTPGERFLFISGAAGGAVSLTGLEPGTIYAVKVQAVSAAGKSPEAESFIATLSPGLTPTFRTPSGLRGGFRVAVSNYDRQYAWNVSVDQGGRASINSNGVVTVSGLAVSTTATLTVTSSRDGYESVSQTVAGASLAGTPPAFTAANPSLSGRVGTVYVSYTFRASGDPAPTFEASGTLPPGLTLNSSTGILSGTPTAAGSYTFTVSASNGVGSAVTTAAITVVVAAATPAVPAGVAGVQAGTSKSADISWNASTNATSYLATLKQSGTTIDTCSTSGALTCRVTAAQYGAYTVTVKAINGAESSSQSPSANVTLTQPAPSKPTNVTATQVGTSKNASVSWNASLNASSYVVTMKQNGTVIDTCSTATLACTVTSTAYGTYSVTVTAESGNLSAAVSDVVSVTLTQQTPAVPRGVAASQVGTSKSSAVSWNASSNAASYVVTMKQNGTVIDTCTTATLTCTVTAVVYGTYLVTVKAVNGDLSSAASDAVSVTLTQPTPAVPRGVAASQVGTSKSASVSWNASSNAASYVATMKQNGTVIDTCMTTTLTCSITARAYGAYAITVKAVSGDLSSAASDTVGVALTPPTPATPAGVGASQVDTSKAAAVSWNAASNATSYVVIMKQNGVVIDTCTTSTLTCSVTASSYGSFVIGVLAKNENVPSVASGSTTVTLVDPTPTVPRGVAAIQVGTSKSASVSWNASSNAASYVATMKQNGTVIDTCMTSTLTCSVTAAAYGTYVVTVKAVKGDLSSATSGSVSVSLADPAPATPSGVQGVQAGTTKRVTVSWNASAKATSYVVTLKQNGVEIDTCTTSTLTCAVTGDTYGTFVVSVLAKNGDALSATAGVSTVTIIDPAPASPTDVQGVQMGTTKRLTVSWTPVRAATSYTATLRIGAEVAGTCNSSTSSCEITSTSYGVYSLIVKSAKDSYVSVASEAAVGNLVAPPADLPAPSGVAVTPSDGQITVTWIAVAGAASYKLRQSADGGNTWTQIATKITTTKYVVDKLVNGKVYLFAVAVVGAQDVWSDPISVEPRTVPGVVVALTATGAKGAISVKWGAPADDGGSDITEYRVTTKGGSYADWTEVKLVTGKTGVSDYSVSIRNLTAGKYSFRVTAANAAGRGLNDSVSAKAL